MEVSRGLYIMLIPAVSYECTSGISTSLGVRKLLNCFSQWLTGAGAPNQTQWILHINNFPPFCSDRERGKKDIEITLYSSPKSTKGSGTIFSIPLNP